MAPFLVRHPVLIHRWFAARETALARVRALPEARESEAFMQAMAEFRAQVEGWRTADARSGGRDRRA